MQLWEKKRRSWPAKADVEQQNGTLISRNNDTMNACNSYAIIVAQKTAPDTRPGQTIGSKLIRRLPQEIKRQAAEESQGSPGPVESGKLIVRRLRRVVDWKKFSSSSTAKIRDFSGWVDAERGGFSQAGWVRVSIGSDEYVDCL